MSFVCWALTLSPLGDDLCILHMIHIVHRRERRVQLAVPVYPALSCSRYSFIVDLVRRGARLLCVRVLYRRLLLPRQRQLRRCDFAALLLQSLDCLLLLVVDNALFLEVLDLHLH